eukprot:15476202-Alexandrium_andersonii.AAC.1
MSPWLRECRAAGAAEEGHKHVHGERSKRPTKAEREIEPRELPLAAQASRTSDATFTRATISCWGRAIGAALGER